MPWIMTDLVQVSFIDCYFLYLAYVYCYLAAYNPRNLEFYFGDLDDIINATNSNKCIRVLLNIVRETMDGLRISDIWLNLWALLIRLTY